MRLATASIFILCLAMLMPFRASTQTYLPVNEKGRWGAIDSSGKQTISPQYHLLSAFDTNGLAIYRDAKGLFGLVHGSGEERTAAKFDKIVPLPQERIVAWVDGQAGLYDFYGKEIIAPAYTAIGYFTEDLFLLDQAGKRGLAHHLGKAMLPAVYDRITPLEDNQIATILYKQEKKGAVSKAGELILPAEYDSISILPTEVRGFSYGKVSRVKLSANGQVQDQQDYPNAAALQLSLRRENIDQKKSLLAGNPSMAEPRWVKNGFDYALTDGVGRPIIKQLFFDVGVDSQDQLSLARTSNEEDQIMSFLIDHKKGEVLFAKTLQDVMITDFLHAEWARATVDTLWDALVNKSGELKRSLTYQGQDYPLINIGNFYDGRAWFHSGERFGYIDTMARVVIAPEYERASDFNGGVAIASKQKKLGAIDTTGKHVVPFNYDGISPYDAEVGLLRVKKGKGRDGRWGAVNRENKEIVSFQYEIIGPFKNGLAAIRQQGRFGLINERGQVVLAPTLEVDNLDTFSNGIAKIYKERYIEETGVGPQVRYRYHGYIDQSGRVLLQPIYTDTGDFEMIWAKQEGLAKVLNNRKVGYVNYLGEVVLEAQYDQINGFDSIWAINKGVVPAIRQGKKGYVDHNGLAVLPFVYEEVSDDFIEIYTRQKGAAIAKKEGNYGCINHLGEIVIPFAYELISSVGNERAIARKNGKWGVVNFKNQEVLPFVYRGIRFLDGSGQKWLEIYKDSPIFYKIDGNGQVVESYEERPDTTALQLKKVDNYAYPEGIQPSGFAIIERKGLYGLANPTGQVLIKPKYKKMGAFNEGLAWFQEDGKTLADRRYGYINQKGEEVVKAQFMDAGNFGDGLAPVRLKPGWGYINKQGSTKIPPTFKQAQPFSGGYAFVNNNQIINTDGKAVGQYLGEGKLVSGFSHGRAVMELTEGQFHLRPDGLPAYYGVFDTVTPFAGSIAFASKGEIWKLRRIVNEGEAELTFSKSKKNAYLEEHGYGRVIKTKYGDYIKDREWEKISEGRWKMIGPDGNTINEAVYEEVVTSADGSFLAMLPRRYGIANLDGELIASTAFEIISSVAGTNIYRLEKVGVIHYLSAEDGRWLWNPTK